jgi:hypothetical protein
LHFGALKPPAAKTIEVTIKASSNALSNEKPLIPPKGLRL